MKTEQAIEKIKKQRGSIESLDARPRFSPEFKKWYRDTCVLLKRIFGDDAYQVKDFQKISFTYRGAHVIGDSTPFERRYRSALKEAYMILTSIYEEIEEYGLEEEKSSPANPMTTIELVAGRFHSVARQLRKRHSQRDTIDIQDEYDAQDLLHALLRIFFSDIRAEEWTPSYGGKSSRMDFLLHKEEIVIETKMTRRTLGEKEVVDELIIDISRYKEHPRCQTLVCFIYDPEGYIGNSEAIINDLEKLSGDLEVRVFVKPEIT